MDESITTSSFQFSTPLWDKDISEITHQMSELEGVAEVKASEKEVIIAYNGYVQTKNVLREKLENAGFTILDDTNKSRGWFQKLVQYLAKGNKEAFKGGKPDCCNPKVPKN
ncbi:LDCC motif putative metal-binding protein [Marinilabilia sp.]|uniref:LDCC motif putative metal-binding protein n=1 Tax=Marinilabilia sp. TaxID=2021252 RepID=UPI0025C4267C|nr:LDCC motif putative metal-binding protein [Marinilabilia sp.]